MPQNKQTDKFKVGDVLVLDKEGCDTGTLGKQIRVGIDSIDSRLLLSLADESNFTRPLFLVVKNDIEARGLSHYRFLHIPSRQFVTSTKTWVEPWLKVCSR